MSNSVLIERTETDYYFLRFTHYFRDLLVILNPSYEICSKEKSDFKKLVN